MKDVFEILPAQGPEGGGLRVESQPWAAALGRSLGSNGAGPRAGQDDNGFADPVDRSNETFEVAPHPLIRLLTVFLHGVLRAQLAQVEDLSPRGPPPGLSGVALMRWKKVFQLGRIVAVHHRPSTSYWIFQHIRCLSF